MYAASSNHAMNNPGLLAAGDSVTIARDRLGENREGQSGVINLVDLSDNTIEVRFDDGECRWFQARDLEREDSARVNANEEADFISFTHDWSDRRP